MRSASKVEPTNLVIAHMDTIDFEKGIRARLPNAEVRRFLLVRDDRIRNLGCVAVAFGEPLHGHFRDTMVMNESGCDHQDVEQLMAVELK